jgi:hypothetical protein
MGIGDILGSTEIIKTFRLGVKRALESIDVAIDQTVGSETELAQKSLEELNVALEKVSAAIENPDLIKLDGGNLATPGTSAFNEGTFTQQAILPRLRARQSFIMGRIAELNAKQHIREAVADKVVDADARDALIKSVESAFSEVMERNKILEKQVGTAAEKRQQMILETELKERRAKIYRAWTAREVVASIAGVVLLVGLGIALVVAMFIGTPVAEVVSSAFLLILGYFFGQSTVAKDSS